MAHKNYDIKHYARRIKHLYNQFFLNKFHCAYFQLPLFKLYLFREKVNVKILIKKKIKTTV